MYWTSSSNYFDTHKNTFCTCWQLHRLKVGAIIQEVSVFKTNKRAVNSPWISWTVDAAPMTHKNNIHRINKILLLVLPMAFNHHLQRFVIPKNRIDTNKHEITFTSHIPLTPYTPVWQLTTPLQSRITLAREGLCCTLIIDGTSATLPTADKHYTDGSTIHTANSCSHLPCCSEFAILPPNVWMVWKQTLNVQ